MNYKNSMIVLCLTLQTIFFTNKPNIQEQLKIAIQNNNRDEVIKLLPQLQISNNKSNNNNLIKEEVISLNEIKQNSILDLSGLKKRNGGTAKVTVPFDPQLVELLKEAQEVMEKRKKTTAYGLREFSNWSKEAKIRFGVASAVLLSAFVKTGFDVAAIFDETNNGFKVVADLIGDGMLLVGSSLQLYEGYNNKAGKEKYNQACAIKEDLSDIARNQVDIETSNEQSEEEDTESKV